MLPRARHEYLLRWLELHESIRASDVAEELGVSQVTIRRDIAKLDADGLLAQVHGGALAVRSAARKPAAARTLVGVVVPSATVYYPEIVRGMETVAAALRTRLALGISNYRPELERTRVERLLTLGVKGLVLTPTTNRGQPDDVAAWLESIPVPVVVMERHVDETPLVRELDSARTDHVHGALLAVDHLRRLGHARVALGIFDRTPTSRWIRAGYTDAVDRLGLDLAPVRTLPKGEDDPSALARALGDLLDECRASDTRAVVAHTDYHAARLVELAHVRGLRVPEDLAIVAYDDELAELADVPLTAVTPPRRELGREALRLLVSRTGGTDEEPGPPRHVQLLPRLTVRESCGHP
ncbi:LacI family DNA-binding transcriptional regulator [Phytoactinopolyspora halotolerans]|uniref:DeoR/GlpR family transcriptional regulator n=1 Tax=Phytoactinopolyspora halotolerans TaxID=1981512 RepID=A0A6L9SG20_9ACTN|nr:LacI family DNA-binding transcriptional regulator [Phytoactinopolyspora halotolerans]NEE03588.1 DeoR/GlpR family transcriptional regulator [Phytoactinopolyspora halotolerans]